MSKFRWSCLLTAAVLFVPWPASAEPCTLSVEADGLRCVADDGTVAWERHHPALRSAATVPPIPHLLLGARVYYAVRGDLIEADRESGVVRRRTRYPAPIEALVQQGDTLVLTLAYEDDAPAGGVHRVETPHPVSGRRVGQWSWTYVDGHAVVARIDAERTHDTMRESGTPADERGRALARLAEADPTNPHYALHAGLAFAEAGDTSAASGAFARAAEAPEAGWQDLLLVAAGLEAADRPREAAHAHGRGLDAMAADGVDASSVPSLFPLALLTRDLRPMLAAALAHGDLRRVDAVVGRYADLFLNVEGAARTHALVAREMAVAGEHDLAEAWHRRADAAEASPTVPIDTLVTGIDRRLFLVFGLLPVLLIGGLVLGVRCSVRVAAERDTPPALPRPSPAELVSPLLLAAAIVGLTAGVGVRVFELHTWVTTPVAVGQGALAAPGAAQWLEGLAPGEARARLLEEARAARAAFEAGDAPAPAPDLAELLQQAVADDARARMLAPRALAGLPGAVLPTDSDALSNGLAVRPVHGVLLLFVFPLLVVLAYRIANAVPGLRRLWVRVVPGSAGLPFPVGLLALLLLTLGVLALLGLHHVMASAALPATEGYFGLPPLDARPLPAPQPAWGWGLLGAALLLHGIGLLRERASGETTHA